MHNNDQSQLEQWYDDLTKRLAATHQPNNSPYVKSLVEAARLIGDVLNKRLPIWNWNSLKKKR